MISINSQEIRYFYRNIVKTGNVYRVKYNNKDYGEFRKLSDALYERMHCFFVISIMTCLSNATLKTSMKIWNCLLFPKNALKAESREQNSIKRKGKGKSFLTTR